MVAEPVQEIGIWRWERRPRGATPSGFGGRTSYAVAVDGEALLVDPLVGDDDPALGALDDLVRGRVRILVTMPYHTRSARFHSIGSPPRAEQPIEIPSTALSSSATPSSRPAAANRSIPSSTCSSRSGSPAAIP
jgi:hypothetical protein